MNNASKIQIGILAVIALMVGYYVFLRGDSNTAKDAAQQRLESAVQPEVTTPNAPPAETAPPGPKTTVKFSEENYNFGTVKEGEKVQHIYKFTNTGTNPLTITDAKGSCGCTVPQWPKEPIAPGATGEIKVEFDSKGKPGKQSKTVTVKANTEPFNTILKIEGDVTPDPNSPKANNSGTLTPVTPPAASH
jgi:hypothetical protein